MGNPRFRRSLGIFLVAISAIFSFNLYMAMVAFDAEIYTYLVTTIILWSSLCLPELAIGIHLIFRGAKSETASATSGQIESVSEPVITARTVCPNCNRILATEDIVCPHCEYVIPTSLV